MPNHVMNRLEIIGTKEQVREVRKAISYRSHKKGKSIQYIDFNKLIPMPRSLNIESGTLGEYGYCAVTNKNLNSFTTVEYAKSRLDSYDAVTRNKALKLGKVYASNIEKYGCCTWYDWCCENWGTKWNAYSIELESPNVIMFKTAWSAPIPVLEALGNKFPTIDFVFEYADEDTGCNTGCAVIKDGNVSLHKLENESDEAYEMAFKLRPDYKENYKKIDGKWKYIEE